MKTASLSFCLFLALITLTHIGCDKSEDYPSDPSTITVGVFTKSGSTYTATGHELIFDSKANCQTWTRTAPGGDAHSATSHLHYNAAANVSYNSTEGSFTWTEFGPEIDQAAIDSTCAAGMNGVNKTVNSTSYYQDKPNVYLKITKFD